MIYVTGDMHGDINRFYSSEFKNLEEHDTLIVTGDFGFVWNGSKKEKKTLKYLGSRKYNVCFIDGPHDNFDEINSYRKTIWRGGRVHRISGNLFHLCRGQIFNIEGCTVFTFGGGEGSDKDIRNGTNVWFRDELPSPVQMRTGAKNLDSCDCKVDFIITHEPPATIKRAMLLRDGKAINTNKLNGYLEELNNSCEFRQWYFGAFHQDKVITQKHTAVYKELIPINYSEFGGFIIGSGKKDDKDDSEETVEIIEAEQIAAEPEIDDAQKMEEMVAEQTKDVTSMFINDESDF